MSKAIALNTRRLRNRKSFLAWLAGIAALGVALPLGGARVRGTTHPGARVLMDAHNCYPYFGWWSDRIDRALSAGAPLAIEQDLLWVTDPKTGAAHSLVAHGAPFTGKEPSMREYFFERVRPIIEQS